MYLQLSVRTKFGWTQHERKISTDLGWIGERRRRSPRYHDRPPTPRTVQVAASVRPGVGMGRLFLEYVEVPCLCRKLGGIA
eukprot:scaffold82458_cov45-Phaeocystis_antarctica.AAC.2